MKTIITETTWTYRTPLETIEYPAGKHKVAEHIAEAHAKDIADGHRIAATGTPGDTAPAEG